MHPFHLAFPVHSLQSARAFYGELLGCPEGRSSSEWVDFNLYGNAIEFKAFKDMNSLFAK